MDPKYKSLTANRDNLKAKIQLDEEELFNLPYWPYVCVLTLSISPFLEGDKIGFGIGGFWLGVAAACLVNRYNQRQAIIQRIKANTCSLQVVQRMLEEHKAFCAGC